MHADGPTTPSTALSAPADDPSALVSDAVAMLHRHGTRTGRTILGLTGPPGAGKSTLAHHLISAINHREGPGTAAYLPLDGFHLANPQLDRLGLRTRKGAPATFDSWGYVALLRRVVAERFHDIYVPDFDRAVDEPVAARHVIHPHARLVITEGNYLANAEQPWPEARALLHELWYLHIDDTVRDTRLMHRHTSGGQDTAAARDRISANDQPNAEYVKAARAACDRVVLPGDLPETPE
ncbi:nucleoside/nucleotide kinase family protein [Kitasatospora sp. McL0602]|uniref:nucleoside/nucleotide kinase family protein n=1 Tax=Kitasatospora sp. McL0602 TaxID=3439530 RepID=UPI003F88FE06